MHFDFTTIHACNALINATFGILFFAFWSMRRVDEHFLWWSASLLLSSASVATFGFAYGHVWWSALCYGGVAFNVTLLWSGIRSFDDYQALKIYMLVPPPLIAITYGVVASFVGSVEIASALATVGLAINVWFPASYAFKKRSPGSFGRHAVAWSLIAYIPFYCVSIGLNLAWETTRLGTSLILFSDVVLNIVFVVGLLAMTEEKARAALHRLAQYDALTGALNRRGLFEYGSVLQSDECCVLVSDLDHFKAVNDTFGHAAGDAVLKAFVERTVAFVGTKGVVGRLGGEEFAVVVRNAGYAEGIRIADELRICMVGLPAVSDGVTIPFTVSIGFAFKDKNTAFHDALQTADQALYRAKSAGRNRIAA